MKKKFEKGKTTFSQMITTFMKEIRMRHKLVKHKLGE